MTKEYYARKKDYNILHDRIKKEVVSVDKISSSIIKTSDEKLDETIKKEICRAINNIKNSIEKDDIAICKTTKKQVIWGDNSKFYSLESFTKTWNDKLSKEYTIIDQEGKEYSFEEFKKNIM